VFTKRQTLFSGESGVLRWRSDAIFWERLRRIREAYVYETIGEWHHLAQRETFVRMFAALPDARQAMYFCRVEREYREYHAIIDVNFKTRQSPRSRDLKLSVDIIARVPLHSNADAEIARVKTLLLQWLCFCSRTRFYDACMRMRSWQWRQHLIAPSLISFRPRASIESMEKRKLDFYAYKIFKFHIMTLCKIRDEQNGWKQCFYTDFWFIARWFRLHY